MRGLADALAYARGEVNRGRVTTIRVLEPDVKMIRRKLGVTQVEFAARFAFSLATVRDWEQGRRRPLGPARILLTIIDREPEAVERALRRVG